MVAFPEHQLNQTPHNDPLRLAGGEPIPFPTRAARLLSEERSQRYDDVEGAMIEAELRIREFASMMGMMAIHDDPPNAA